MSTYVFITHTAWSEAPRIRHQLARLIRDQGHQIIFFERAIHPWRLTGEVVSHPESGVAVVRSHSLIHHQLRVIPPLDWINSAFVRMHIGRRIRDLKIESDVTVFNFAHDYHFLRGLFPKARRVVTIIHDDWEAQARLPWFGHVTRSMRRTCRASDEVYAVSTSLQKRIATWCKAGLLFPWSLRKYQAPHPRTSERNILLFWGFINFRLDLALTRAMAESLKATHPGFRILMVGPAQVEAHRIGVAKQLEGLDNISIHPEADIDELPLDQVIAGIIPYTTTTYNAAVELPNKVLHLLSRGMPIIASGMPNLVKEPFTIQMSDRPSFEAALQECISHFNDWQPAIRAFVEEQSATARLKTLGITSPACDV